MKVKKVYLLAALVVLAVVVAGCAQQSKPEVKEVTTPAGTPESTEKETKGAEGEGAGEGHEEAVVVNEGEAAVTVILKNYEFDPVNIEVERGKIVEFKSEEGTHTVTIAESGHDEPLIDEEVAQGESILVEFNEAGSYDLVCKYHEDQMVGRIVVV